MEDSKPVTVEKIRSFLPIIVSSSLSAGVACICKVFLKMGWTEIILGILGLLGTIDLGRIVFIKAGKKKAEAEAESVEHANESTAVETLEKAIEQMSKTNESYAHTIEQLQANNDEEHARNIAKDESIATLQTLICKHMGCSLREPISGQGRKWFEDNKEDISLGLDFLPINQLMFRYGEKKRREEQRKAAEEAK